MPRPGATVSAHGEGVQRPGPGVTPPGTRVRARGSHVAVRGPCRRVRGKGVRGRSVSVQSVGGSVSGPGTGVSASRRGVAEMLGGVLVSRIDAAGRRRGAGWRSRRCRGEAFGGWRGDRRSSAVEAGTAARCAVYHGDARPFPAYLRSVSPLDDRASLVSGRPEWLPVVLAAAEATELMGLAGVWREA